MAVVSQPFDRSALCEAPGEPQEEYGEFWEQNPWNIAFRHNLSAFERNRTFLNLEGTGFVDISYLTGADADGDSRSSVAADVDHDGRLDLLVRQVGGGPLLLYENRFAAGNSLTVSLRGVSSNRLGIGARIVARVGENRIVRELFPINSFHSQSPSRVHLGLGEADVVDELQVSWPSGQEQTLRDLPAGRHPAGRHIVITENSEDVEVVAPGETIAPDVPPR